MAAAGDREKMLARPYFGIDLRRVQRVPCTATARVRACVRAGPVFHFVYWIGRHSDVVASLPSVLHLLLVARRHVAASPSLPPCIV